MPATETLIRRARTRWRPLLAWGLMAVAVSVALALGYSGDQRSGENRTLLVRRGPPCVRETSGPLKGKPSEGCRRIARLVAEECRLEPRLCAPLVRLVVTTPEGRQLVRSELHRALQLRAQPPAAARPRPTRPGNSRGPRHAPGGTTATPPRRPPAPSPVASPPPPPAAPPSPVSPPPVPVPRVPSPSDVVHDPVGSVHGLGCQLGVCPPLP